MPQPQYSARLIQSIILALVLPISHSSAQAPSSAPPEPLSRGLPSLILPEQLQTKAGNELRHIPVDTNPEPLVAPPAGPPTINLDGPRLELRRIPPTEEEEAAPPVAEPAPAPATPKTARTEALAWWGSKVQSPLRPGVVQRQIGVTGLVMEALQYSEHIQAIRQIPLAEAENIVRAEAEFDPQSYLDNKLDYLNKPVGNTLTTGGPPRLLQPQWNTTGGIRRKMESGATVDISQGLGLNTSNSVFQLPVNQGTSELAIHFNQPLMRGRGADYNRGAIVLAQINTKIAEDRLARDIQDHLLKVTKAYWELYLDRANLLQQQRHLARAEFILRELEARRALDATTPQILRAKSAVASRQSDLARSQAAIRISEARIRSLVNPPEKGDAWEAELIPVDAPLEKLEQTDLKQSLATAAHHRPEVNEALRQIEAARVRLDISRNELMPSLNLVVETYARGLQGGFNVAGAYTSQWDTGGPSVTAGVLFEMPWGNRSALARERQKQYELTQMMRTFKATMASLSFEVEAAVREVEATYKESMAKRAAVLATRKELDASQHRWRLLAGDDRSATFLLDDIFNAQDRLREEERALAQAVVAYNLSLAQLRRATGNLVEVELLAPGK